MASKQQLVTRFARPGLLALGSALFFWVAGSPWLFPGESAIWAAKLLGVWGEWGAIEPHPLVSPLLRAVGVCLPEAWGVAGLNALAAVAGGLCVWLLCHLVRGLLYVTAGDPRARFALEGAAGASVRGAFAATLAAAPFVLASGHCNWQIFDVLLALVGATLALRAARLGTRWAMAWAALAAGLLACEAPWLLVAAPVLLLGAGVGYWAAAARPRVEDFGRALVLPAAVGAALGLVCAIGPGVAQGANVWTLLLGFAQLRVGELLGYLREGWLLVLLFGVLPCVLCVLMARAMGENRRSLAGVLTYLSAAVLAGCCYLPLNVVPSALAERWSGAQPVALSAMGAFAVAFLAGAAVLMIQVKRPPEATQERAGVRRLAAAVGWGVRVWLGVALLVGIEWQMWPSVSALRQVPLTRPAAEAVLAELPPEGAWLLGDGVLDPYLAVAIAEARAPVVLCSLSEDNRPAAMARLRAALASSPLFAEKAALREQLDRTLDLGIIPFLQDWLRADPDSETRFATLSLPDLWLTGDRQPLPTRWAYRGSATRETQLAALAQAPFIAGDAVSAGLIDALERAKTLEALPAPVRTFAGYLRRQRGFTANNTAFFLAASDRLEEAYARFCEVYAWDPENVSALFNIFELVNGGLHAEQRAWCEREFKSLLSKLGGRKYRLWALARTYGYIRSPQLISALAGSWVMSGQTGAALSGLDLAMELLDDETRTGLQSAVAALYTLSPGKRKESIARYRELLARSTDPRRTLECLRQLLRMNILEGNFAEARRLLEQAEASAGQDEMAYERALYLASAGDAVGSRIALERFLERAPKHLDALAMLATLQLQAGEFEPLRAATLPKLITAAGTEDNYFVQIVLGQLAEREGALPKARAAYLRALALRPEVYALRDTVLTLDIRLNDRASAEQHARKFLYQDRAHPLSNYVMGSLALAEGELKRAESYLLAATAPDAEHPLPEAFNDLAETGRRLGKWAAALSAAQRACELAPKLAVARETAAAALLELGRLAEAKALLDEAFALEAEQTPGKAPDPRFLITRARLHLAAGETELARAALAQAKGDYATLDRGAQAEFDRAAQAAGLK